MLISDPARQHVAFFPLVFLAGGVAFGLLGVLVAMEGAKDDLLGDLMVTGAAVFGVAWFILNIRFARRDGDEIMLRSVLGSCRVPVEGSTIGIVQGGAAASPHLDVLLQPDRGEPLRLARLEIVGVGRAPAVAREIAAALRLPVDEQTVMPVEAQLAGVAPKRRPLKSGSLGVIAIAAACIIGSFVMLYLDDAATIRFRCADGIIESGGKILTGDTEMTFRPGSHTFEMHPPKGPAWTKQVELVAGEKLTLDCRDRPKSGSRKAR